MEEARAKFWTNIDAVTNEVKICISDAKRDAKEIQRERKLKAMDMEGRLNSLFGGRRDIREELREAERKRGNTRVRTK